MANYDTPWWPITRLGFVEGCAIIDQDLINEQGYQISARMRAMRGLRTPGLANGFALSLTRSSTGGGLTVLNVAAGTAFDASGNAIVLAPSTFSATMAPPQTKTGTPTDYWTPSTQVGNAWAHDFGLQELPVGEAVFLFVQFAENQERGPSQQGGVQGYSRFQQTPILDWVTTAAQLGGYQALPLATLTYDGTNITIGYGPQQLSGLAFPGSPIVEAPVKKGAIAPAPTYARMVPGDGGAILEIGGSQGVVVGLTTPDSLPDPSGAAPFNAMLGLSYDNSIIFTEGLTLSCPLTVASGNNDSLTLAVAGTALGYQTKQGSIIKAPTFSAGPAGSPLLVVSNATVEVDAPKLQLDGIVSGPSITLGGTLALGTNALQIYDAGGATARGFVAPLGSTQGLGLGGDGSGVALGTSSNGSFTPALTVGGTQVTVAGQLVIPTGDVTVQGLTTTTNDLFVGGLVSHAQWNASMVIDPTLQPGAAAGDLFTLSGSLTTHGGALVIIVTGALYLQPPTTAAPTTALITVKVDGTQIGTITGVLAYYGVGFGEVNLAMIQVPTTAFPATTSGVGPHSVTLSFPSTVPLFVASYVQCALSVLALEVPATAVAAS